MLIRLTSQVFPVRPAVEMGLMVAGIPGITLFVRDKTEQKREQRPVTETC